MILLDTHILVNAWAGQLRALELGKLRADESWAIADITLWEIAMLHKAGRIVLDLEDEELRDALAPVRILPITAEIARLSCQLDFKSDPADHLIAATSIVHALPLLTRDQIIRRSKLLKLA